MLTSEIIMSAIGIVNENKVSEFEVKAESHANYDMVTITKDNSNPFTYTDLVKVIDGIPAMADFKVSLQYGDDGGEYFGYTYMDEMDCNGEDMLLFNGNSKMDSEEVFQCKHIKLRYYNAKYKERIIYIQNMDDGGDYSGSRPMEYMEIYIDKTGGNHRVNLG